MDDGRARLPGQLAGGDQRGEHGRADDFAALVHDEAPVGVAVEGEADVRLVLPDRALQVAQVLRLDRVGLVVGERAVELEVKRDRGDRQALEHRRHCVAAHAVARVDDHLQRADARDVDQLLEVLGVAGEQVPARNRARRAVVGRNPVRDHPLDLGQASLDADRLRARLAELDAVVLGRVVARGDHRAGDVEETARVVHHVGRAQPAVDDVRALRRRAAAERRGERARCCSACHAR